MKARSLRTVTVAVLIFLAAACSETAPSTHVGRGVVTEVKLAEGQVVLDHEEIPGVMKAMTMGFDVTSPALLEGVEAGQAVEFELRYEGGRYFVSALRPR